MSSISPDPHRFLRNMHPHRNLDALDTVNNMGLLRRNSEILKRSLRIAMLSEGDEGKQSMNCDYRGDSCLLLTHWQ